MAVKKRVRNTPTMPPRGTPAAKLGMKPGQPRRNMAKMARAVRGNGRKK